MIRKRLAPACLRWSKTLAKFIFNAFSSILPKIPEKLKVYFRKFAENRKYTFNFACAVFFFA